MTLEEMMTTSRVFLTAEDVSEVLGCNPHSIRVQAQRDPAKLGYAVSVQGTRVRIPREAFIRFLTGGQHAIR